MTVENVSTAYVTLHLQELDCFNCRTTVYQDHPSWRGQRHLGQDPLRGEHQLGHESNWVVRLDNRQWGALLPTYHHPDHLLRFYPEKSVPILLGTVPPHHHGLRHSFHVSISCFYKQPSSLITRRPSIPKTVT